MAFATSNQQTSYFGNMKITYGQWSGADADASATLSVQGGQVWLAEFVSQDASGKYEPAALKYSVTGTAGILTITVYNLAGVTNGRYLIVTT